MSDDRIEIACPRCSHRWWLKVSELGQLQRTIYRSPKERALQEYRVRCPKDSTYVIVKIEETDHE